MNLNYKKKIITSTFVTVFIIALLGLLGYAKTYDGKNGQAAYSLDLNTIPAFEDKPYVEVNHNQPCFSERDKSKDSFEVYSRLDALGRCGVAFANVGIDLMPTEERGAIGFVKPSGWHIAKYDFVDGKYLYNRCHLIAYQLCGENANERNLITGTRYLNTVGMQPFESMVAEYVKETKNHVLYRVTPIYNGNNLVASGVEMEGYSVEDDGKGISFHIFAYNNQPNVQIDYATGDNWLADEFVSDHEENESQLEEKTQASGKTASDSERYSYIGNRNTKRFHYPDCNSVGEMKEKNKVYWTDVTRDEIIGQGYKPCGNCHP